MCNLNSLTYAFYLSKVTNEINCSETDSLFREIVCDVCLISCRLTTLLGVHVTCTFQSAEIIHCHINKQIKLHFQKTSNTEMDKEKQMIIFIPIWWEGGGRGRIIRQ